MLQVNYAPHIGNNGQAFNSQEDLQTADLKAKLKKMQAN